MHLLLALSLGTLFATQVDRRIVDQIVVGDRASEVRHAYAGDGVTSGTANGRAYRRTHAWLRYALDVFDDTEVTIAATFLGSPDTTRTFDVIVENQVIATHSYRSARIDTVEFRVPVAITNGKANVLVVLRAINGSTPRLVELRSVQDHNE